MHYLLADLALDKSIDGARGALCCMLLPHREVGQGRGRPLLQPYVRRVAAHCRDQRLAVFVLFLAAIAVLALAILLGEAFPSKARSGSL